MQHARKRPLEKPRRRLKDNFRMDLMEIGWKGVDWHLAQNRDQWTAAMNAVKNLGVP
jgi:hypothetical protein